MGRAGCSFDPCCSKMPAVRSGCPPSASLSAHGPLDGTPTPHCPFVAARSMHLCSIRTFCEVPSRGTWCSGITSASHAEGPGFKSQCLHGLFYQAGAAASSLPMGVQLFDMCFSDSTCVLRLRTWLKAVAAWDARGAASIPAALRCQPCAQAAHPVQACRRMACWMAHRPHTAHLLRPGQCISAL